MKAIAAIAVLALAGACAGPDDGTAITYDDPQYPGENTALVIPAPENPGRIVITAAGGRKLACGGWLSRTECQSVRLKPGTTILRLDFSQNTDGRLSTARDMDLPINVVGGHTYHIVANVVRDTAPGQGGARVFVQAVDKGVGPPLPVKP